ncbi:MAG: zinc ribbon domain-containing protein [bacterium]|nr:zinc ribbon domain-containing protein [bacterium]
MRCSRCGQELADDAVFCHACGEATPAPGSRPRFATNVLPSEDLPSASGSRQPFATNVLPSDNYPQGPIEPVSQPAQDSVKKYILPACLTVCGLFFLIAIIAVVFFTGNHIKKDKDEPVKENQVIASVSSDKEHNNSEISDPVKDNPSASDLSKPSETKETSSLEPPVFKTPSQNASATYGKRNDGVLTSEKWNISYHEPEGWPLNDLGKAGLMYGSLFSDEKRFILVQFHDFTERDPNHKLQSLNDKNVDIARKIVTPVVNKDGKSQVYEDEIVTINGMKMLRTSVIKNDADEEVTCFLTMRESKVYLFMFTSPQSEHEKYLPDFNKMIQSINFLR